MIKQINTENGRFYDIGNNVIYESVTTVLSRVFDKSQIDLWKLTTPNYQKIVDESSLKGEQLHEMCEFYGKDIPFNVSSYPVISQRLWKSMKPCIDKYCKQILISEQYMYSHELRLAGCVDNISIDHNNKLIVVDYKNSRKRKYKHLIISYYIQVTIYAIMFNEMYKTMPSYGVIMIANPISPSAQEFIVDFNIWIPITKQIIKAYHMMKEKNVTI